MAPSLLAEHLIEHISKELLAVQLQFWLAAGGSYLALRAQETPGAQARAEENTGGPSSKERNQRLGFLFLQRRDTLQDGQIVDLLGRKCKEGLVEADHLVIGQERDKIEIGDGATFNNHLALRGQQTEKLIHQGIEFGPVIDDLITAENQNKMLGNFGYNSFNNALQDCCGIVKRARQLFGVLGSGTGEKRIK
jgi:hypothetical protein